METAIEEKENLEQEQEQQPQPVRQLVPPQEAFDKQLEIERQYKEMVKQQNK